MLPEFVSSKPVEKHPDEDKKLCFDFTLDLDGASIEEITGSDPRGIALGASTGGTISIDDEQILAEDLTIRGRTVAAGKGVLVSVYGGTAESWSNLKLNVRSDDGQTHTLIAQVHVRSEPATS